LATARRKNAIPRISCTRGIDRILDHNPLESTGTVRPELTRREGVDPDLAQSSRSDGSAPLMNLTRGTLLRRVARPFDQWKRRGEPCQVREECAA
jgi:hypothetical protein